MKDRCITHIVTNAHGWMPIPVVYFALDILCYNHYLLMQQNKAYAIPQSIRRHSSDVYLGISPIQNGSFYVMYSRIGKTGKKNRNN